MNVRYSKRAITDLLGIADYVREHNPQAAAAIERRIRSSIRQLEMFPFMGRLTDVASIRMFPLVRYPYLVFYEVLEGEVVIHHIRHARRIPADPGDTRS